MTHFLHSNLNTHTQSSTLASPSQTQPSSEITKSTTLTQEILSQVQSNGHSQTHASHIYTPSTVNQQNGNKNPSITVDEIIKQPDEVWLLFNDETLSLFWGKPIEVVSKLRAAVQALKVNFNQATVEIQPQQTAAGLINLSQPDNHSNQTSNVIATQPIPTDSTTDASYTDESSTQNGGLGSHAKQQDPSTDEATTDEFQNNPSPESATSNTTSPLPAPTSNLVLPPVATSVEVQITSQNQTAAAVVQNNSASNSVDTGAQNTTNASPILSPIAAPPTSHSGDSGQNSDTAQTNATATKPAVKKDPRFEEEFHKSDEDFHKSENEKPFAPVQPVKKVPDPVKTEAPPKKIGIELIPLKEAELEFLKMINNNSSLSANNEQASAVSTSSESGTNPISAAHSAAPLTKEALDIFEAIQRGTLSQNVQITTENTPPAAINPLSETQAQVHEHAVPVIQKANTPPPPPIQAIQISAAPPVAAGDAESTKVLEGVLTNVERSLKSEVLLSILEALIELDELLQDLGDFSADNSNVQRITIRAEALKEQCQEALHPRFGAFTDTFKKLLIASKDTSDGIVALYKKVVGFVCLKTPAKVKAETHDKIIVKLQSTAAQTSSETQALNFLTAYMHFVNGKFQDAKTVFDKTKNYSDALKDLASEFQALVTALLSPTIQNEKSRLASFNLLIAINPEFIQLRLDRAKVLISMSERQKPLEESAEAIKDLNEVEKLDPNNLNAALLRAIISFEKNEYVDAVTYCTKAHSLEPMHVSLLISHAINIAGSQTQNEALESALKELKALSPMNLIAFKNDKQFEFLANLSKEKSNIFPAYNHILNLINGLNQAEESYRKESAKTSETAAAAQKSKAQRKKQNRKETEKQQKENAAALALSRIEDAKQSHSLSGLSTISAPQADGKKVANLAPEANAASKIALKTLDGVFQKLFAAGDFTRILTLAEKQLNDKTAAIRHKALDMKGTAQFNIAKTNKTSFQECLKTLNLAIENELTPGSNGYVTTLQQMLNVYFRIDEYTKFKKVFDQLENYEREFPIPFDLSSLCLRFSFERGDHAYVESLLKKFGKGNVLFIECYKEALRVKTSADLYHFNKNAEQLFQKAKNSSFELEHKLIEMGRIKRIQFTVNCNFQDFKKAYTIYTTPINVGLAADPGIKISPYDPQGFDPKGIALLFAHRKDQRSTGPLVELNTIGGNVSDAIERLIPILSQNEGDKITCSFLKCFNGPLSISILCSRASLQHSLYLSEGVVNNSKANKAISNYALGCFTDYFQAFIADPLYTCNKISDAQILDMFEFQQYELLEKVCIQKNQNKINPLYSFLLATIYKMRGSEVKLKEMKEFISSLDPAELQTLVPLLPKFTPLINVCPQYNDAIAIYKEIVEKKTG